MGTSNLAYPWFEYHSSTIVIPFKCLGSRSIPHKLSDELRLFKIPLAFNEIIGGLDGLRLLFSLLHPGS
jgi:hypothetical protein